MTKKDTLALIKALRSGEYDQTHGQLGYIDTISRTESNCCLGVLCRIKKRPRHVSLRSVAYDGNEDLPDYAKVGMKTLSGDLGKLSDGECYSLVRLNDNGYSFDEIADILYWYIQSDLHEDI